MIDMKKIFKTACIVFVGAAVVAAAIFLMYKLASRQKSLQAVAFVSSYENVTDEDRLTQEAYATLMNAVFEKMKLPRIIGMLLVGILIGPYALGLLDPTILSISDDLRKLALMLILLRAGLSLDLGDLKRVGRPAVLMAFVPATFEVLAVLLTAPLGAIGMDATPDRLLQK